MTTLYVATDEGLAVVSHRNDGAKREWHAQWPLAGKQAQCLARGPAPASDPRSSVLLYCGTFDAGLWRSKNGGRSWAPAGADGAGSARTTSGRSTEITGIPHPSVMSLAVSPDGIVWAGTEPSAIFWSDDGGQTWREEPALRALPSAPTWSFPPRPYTSHVRWIQLDPNDPRRVLASIEAGGVMCSEDGGATWRDRGPDTPRDAHGLAMHPRAPGRVYAASGDAAYAESADGGRTWRRQNEGLTYHYLWSVAVDSADPEVVVVSGSPSAYHAHRSDRAESALFRREGNGCWELVSAGLPPAAGTMTYALAATARAFYAAPHRGDIYRSTDGGRTWEPLCVDWAHPNGVQHHPYVHAILAVDGDSTSR